jgi:hypothetical protein
VSARLAAVALVLALALAGCGGDSGGSEPAGTGATSADQAGTSDGTATSEPAPQKTPKKSADDAPNLDLDQNRQPVPEGSVPPDERTGKPPRYTARDAIPKEQLKAIERPIYEQSRYICKRLGLDGMRREYRIEGTDPKEVARVVAERTYQRAARDAVYSGCLAGLGSGD